MKLIVYSDLHLEFGYKVDIVGQDAGDVLIMAGDICNLRDKRPLARITAGWPDKPILYVPGNHEYYTRTPWIQEMEGLKIWAATEKPNMHVLDNEGVTLHNNYHFFGGTMWTDFNGLNMADMRTAEESMSDFRLIQTGRGNTLRAADTCDYHAVFKTELARWLRCPMSGRRIVISHHTPIDAPSTKYLKSSLRPAFVSLDMPPIIRANGIDLWICGHTHENLDTFVGRTRVVSNQRGYEMTGGIECKDWDPAGLGIEV